MPAIESPNDTNDDRALRNREASQDSTPQRRPPEGLVFNGNGHKLGG